MSAIQELSKSELVQRVQRGYAMASRYRAEAKRAASIGISAGLTVAGGAAAGALAIKYAYLPGSNVRTDVALGSALVLAAAFDLFDGVDDQVADFGAGMLAAAACRGTAKYFVAKAKALGAPVADINI
jgi:hypothetical protein